MNFVYCLLFPARTNLRIPKEKLQTNVQARNRSLTPPGLVVVRTHKESEPIKISEQRAWRSKKLGPASDGLVLQHEQGLTEVRV